MTTHAMIIPVLLFAVLVSAETVTWPLPKGEETDAGGWRVTANGSPVALYRAPAAYFDGQYFFGSFDSDGAVDVTVSSTQSLDHVRILPLSKKIAPRSLGDGRIRFRATPPFQISVERDGRNSPLVLFANKPEFDAPVADAPGVVYFGPGVHRAGAIKLTSNQTLYIAGGAVVQGGVRLEGTNITVRGRGILCGWPWEKYKGPTRYLIDMEKCRGVAIRDIILRASWSWTMVAGGCEDVAVRNVKWCCSRYLNDDGFDIVNSRRVEMTDCFVRTMDDCVAVKGMGYDRAPCEDIVVDRCVLWTDAANIFRVGYESIATTMRNLYASNCDVPHLSRDMRPPTEYWVNTLFYIQPAADMPMGKLSFADFRIDDTRDGSVFLRATPMRCDTKTAGSLFDCTFRNIRFAAAKDTSALIYVAGESPSNRVDNLFFLGVTPHGRVTIGPNVSGISGL
jgi:hypothetical protein